MYQEKLKELKDLTSIEKRVIEDLEGLDDEEIVNYIENVNQYGCISGSVVSLIYYKDTKDFYNTFAEDIDDIVEELDEQGIEPLKEVSYPIFNFLAWLGYEETIRKIADKLEIEL